jgi:thymidylate synthase (FAD)
VQEIEPVELRKQAQKNRQSSTEHCDDPELQLVVNRQIELAEEAYNYLLDSGVAHECARMILPLATSTTLYMKGSVRSWIHYLDVRCDDHTQKEHRLIAEQTKTIFNKQFPMIGEALCARHH